ncbi:MAG: PIN domain-containing protein [Thaumarchaeota archaeon]|nr:PIN domain-containing protein [Nitrososphaerota archaeon]
MRLVINSDRVIAALIKDSKCRQIILSDRFEFLTIDFARSEIHEHADELLEKSGLSMDEFDAILAILFDKIFIVSDVVIRDKMNQARIIMDRIDPNDAPFLALAMATDNDGIWTEDKHFEKQRAIKTWKTTDLLREMDEK